MTEVTRMRWHAFQSAVVKVLLSKKRSIQFFQHQHGNPGVVSRHDPFYLRVISIPVVNHGPETCAPVIAMDQLQMIGRRPCGRNGFINDFDRLLLPQAVQIDFYKSFAQNGSPP